LEHGQQAMVALWYYHRMVLYQQIPFQQLNLLECMKTLPDLMVQARGLWLNIMGDGVLI